MSHYMIDELDDLANEDTCEARSYECCERLTPAQHEADFGYRSAGCTDECTAESHVEW